MAPGRAAAMWVSCTDGVGLAVYEHGAADRSTVVAVHGYPDNHSVWDGVVAILAERYRVVTYDVRGCGASDKPSGRHAYRLAQLVADLGAVLDAVSPNQPVHLLAHDWGSIQAWPAVCSAAFASRVASYTSISGPSLDHAGRWLRDAAQHPGAALRQVLQSYYMLLYQMPVLPELAWRTGWLDRLLAMSSQKLLRSPVTDNEPSRSDADKINGLELYRANMFAHLSRPRPGRTRVPVQVIAPADDAFVSVALQTEAPRPYATNLRTHTIAGGHWVVSDRPDAIARLTSEFVEFVQG